MHNRHLLWRAAFGPSLDNNGWVTGMDSRALFRQLVTDSAGDPQAIDINQPDLNRKPTDEAQKLQLRKAHRDAIRNLNLAWLEQMRGGVSQLREKAAFLWHGHFACRNLNSIFQQQLLETIRKNALGNFGDLLREVSKSAAMLQFLNNNQNRKGHPNENFAREVMELFTMGRGHYTEADIREAARAFTGWGADAQGRFIFRRQQHDTGVKVFLGKKGNFTGDEVIDILLEQRATSRFIAGRIYRFYVSEDADPHRVEWLADRFYASGYDINGILKDVFTSSWFYASGNIGKRVKSPVELLAGLMRQLPVKLQDGNLPLLAQRLLGQVLFYPPGVAGWPSGTDWIDGNSLLLRMRIPAMLAMNTPFKVRPKPDDDQQMGAGELAARNAGATIEWQRLFPLFSSSGSDSLATEMADYFLQTGFRPATNTLLRHQRFTTREELIKQLAVNLMSCPEYQLC